MHAALDQTTIDLNLSKARDEAATAIWNSGSVAIAKNLKQGEFKMAIHRKAHPAAPLSPIYLSLRPKGVKQGALAPDDFDIIGKAMALYANQYNLFDSPRYTAGIPAAGEPFAMSMHDHLNEGAFNLLPLMLQKVGEGDESQIIGPEDEEEFDVWSAQNVLLIDDLVTGASTKLQAIEAIRALGGSVTDLLVFLDRSGGRAAEALATEGVTLHSVWEFDDLLEFWYGMPKGENRTMTRTEFEVISAYPEKLRLYIEAHS